MAGLELPVYKHDSALISKQQNLYSKEPCYPTPHQSCSSRVILHAALPSSSQVGARKVAGENLSLPQL